MTATFTELAERAFSFLDKDGFSITHSNHGELTYRKGRMFVTISWSSRSGELEVFIGPGDPADQSSAFSATDILRMEGAISEKTNLPFQVVDEEKLGSFLQKLAGYVNSYAKPALAGDKMFFRRLAAYRNREATALMAEMHIRQAK